MVARSHVSNMMSLTGGKNLMSLSRWIKEIVGDKSFISSLTLHRFKHAD